MCLAILNPGTDAQVVGENAHVVWEYKAANVRKMIQAADLADDDAVTAELERSLNTLGSQGWELCIEVNGGMIFKRPK
jgi:hypothetical protein